MAQVVLGLGAPHTPHFPTVSREHGDAVGATGGGAKIVKDRSSKKY